MLRPILTLAILGLSWAQFGPPPNPQRKQEKAGSQTFAPTALNGTELGDLRDDIETIQKSADTWKKELERKVQTTEGALADAITALSALRSHVAEMSKGNMTEDVKNIHRISEYIKNREFDKAGKEIQEISEGKMWRIVQNVYDSRESNFELILSFGNSLEYPANFQIFKCLNQEMLLNSHQNPMKQLKLLESFQKIASDEKDAQVGILKNALVVSTRAKTTEDLIFDKITQDNYDILNSIYKLDPKTFENIIEQTIQLVYNKVENIKIVDFIEKLDSDMAKTSGYIMKDVINNQISPKTIVSLFRLTKLTPIDVESLLFKKLQRDLRQRKYEELKEICLKIYNYDLNLFFEIYKKFVAFYYQIDKEVLLDFNVLLSPEESVKKGLIYLNELGQNETVDLNNVLFLSKLDINLSKHQIGSKIKNNLIFKIKDILLQNSTQEIPNRINFLDKDYFNIIMYGVIDQIYNKTDTKNILYFIHNQKNIEQRLTSFNSLLNYMKDKNDLILKNKTITTIFMFNEYVSKIKINELSSVKNEQNKILEKIPDFETQIKDKFKQFVLNPSDDDEVLSYLNIVYGYKHDLFRKIIDQVLKEFYGSVKLEWIIQKIFKLKFVQQYIIGCSLILTHLENNGDFVIQPKSTRVLFALKNSIQTIRQFPNYKMIDPEFKKELKNVENRISNVVEISREKIVHDLKFYKNLSNIIDITNHMQKYSPDIFERIINNVTTSVYNEIAIEKLLGFFHKLKFVNSIILGYESLWKNIERNKHLDKTDIFQFSYGLKELFESSPFRLMSQKLKDKLIFLKCKIPESTRNVVFAQKVCLKNKDKSEFVFSENDHYNYDKSRRNIFGLISKGINLKSYFEIVPKDNYFLIKNTHYDEYLYATMHTYNNDITRRLIYSNTQKTFDNQSLWIFEPSGDYTYIKTKKYDEYMYAPADKYNRDEIRRRIFTFVPGQKDDDTFLWKIVDCTEF